MIWRAWGHGPPLVLLHGGHGSWAHWIRNIDDLANAWTVWAPDLPGCGDSASPQRLDDGSCFGEALARGLGALPDMTAMVDVVGFSMGGVIGAHLAVAAPERVRRLVLVDAGGLNAPLGPLVMTSLRNLTGEALKAAHRANLLSLMIRDPMHADELAVFIQALNAPKNRVKPGPLILPDKLILRLPQVRAQIDAIWGEHDAPHPDPAAQHAILRQVQPGCEMRVIGGSGHWSPYEDAHQFNKTLRNLLATPLRAKRAE